MRGNTGAMVMRGTMAVNESKQSTGIGLTVSDAKHGMRWLFCFGDGE